jgi:hypothetical protein
MENGENYIYIIQIYKKKKDCICPQLHPIQMSFQN